MFINLKAAGKTEVNGGTDEQKSVGSIPSKLEFAELAESSSGMSI